MRIVSDSSHLMKNVKAIETGSGMQRVLRRIPCVATALFMSTISAQTLAAGGASQGGVNNRPVGAKPEDAKPWTAGRYSNVAFIRAELGGWYIRGNFFNPATERLATYGGGGGGVRFNFSLLINHWLVLDMDYRLAGSKYGNVDGKPDLGLDVGVGFSGLRWHGRAPGSFVFGAGAGASLGRPIWLEEGASIYPYGYGRFTIKPTKNSRIQLGYRTAPISTQYFFYDASVWAHDLDLAAGGYGYQIGVRGRLEDVTLDRDPNRVHRSYWIGGFLGIYYE
jgi:hypothetical protein